MKTLSMAFVFLALAFAGCAQVVQVTTYPAGAEVFWDHKSCGVAPCECKIESDVWGTRANIEARLPGYKPYRDRVRYDQLAEFEPIAWLGILAANCIPLIWLSAPDNEYTITLEKE